MDGYAVIAARHLLPVWLAALSLFGGCVGAGASPRQSLPVGAERPVVARTYAGSGITLAVPGSATPAVSATDAYQVCVSGAAACPSAHPDVVELASVTDDQYGDINANGSVTHTIHDRLSWVFTWQGAACPPRTGPRPLGSAAGSAASAAPGDCDWVVLTDATTGKFLVTYAGPPQ